MADRGKIKAEFVDKLSIIRCDYCRGIGHHLRDCPKPRDYPRVDYSKIECHSCGGHVAADCQTPVISAKVDRPRIREEHIEENRVKGESSPMIFPSKSIKLEALEMDYAIPADTSQEDRASTRPIPSRDLVAARNGCIEICIPIPKGWPEERLPQDEEWKQVCLRCGELKTTADNNHHASHHYACSHSPCFVCRDQFDKGHRHKPCGWNLHIASIWQRWNSSNDNRKHQRERDYGDPRRGPPHQFITPQSATQNQALTPPKIDNAPQTGERNARRAPFCDTQSRHLRHSRSKSPPREAQYNSRGERHQGSLTANSGPALHVQRPQRDRIRQIDQFKSDPDPQHPYQHPTPVFGQIPFTGGGPGAFGLTWNSGANLRGPGSESTPNMNIAPHPMSRPIDYPPYPTMQFAPPPPPRFGMISEDEYHYLRGTVESLHRMVCPSQLYRHPSFPYPHSNRPPRAPPFGQMGYHNGF
ncbi:hypothetical protein E2P81_ATG06430 [Venturia nashicola]|uniref:CCHC-type domain-containing protein n=1 Tax=Venturia nashicola TaxID=86259 RepID=A0A4Z1P3H0_9PEZI|nr:hypothetical protein E6O75_ATG06591 [Venturia nashicola]TLD28084.1 hypothetical protein E2P81_ATG06430 [Venturia nashicola]